MRGIFLSIGLALGQFIHRAWRPHDAVLGRSPGLKGYHDMTRHPEGREIPGLLLYRWAAPLLANAAGFRDRAMHFVRHADPRARWLVVAAEPITDVDSTAAAAPKELRDESEANGVVVAFA